MLLGGKVVGVSSNQVAKYIVTSCELEGNKFIIFKENLDHRSDNKAISK